MHFKKLTFILLFSMISIAGISQRYGNSGSDWKALIGGNYFGGGNVHFIEGEISIKNSPSYNLTFQRLLPYGRAAGLSYTFMPTELRFIPEDAYTGDYQAGQANMNIHFLNGVGTQYFSDGQVAPFFEAGMGVALYSFTGDNIGSRTQFLMNFGLGAEISVTEQVGIKLKGGAKLPLFSRGSGVYCGIGTATGIGCGLSLNSSVLVAHWELGGAVTYNF